MQFALSNEGEKIEAAKGVEAFCPNCRRPVLAKCGRIKVRHWAHAAGKDCDPWYEPETEWHRAWKALFDPEQVEVAMGEHRADVLAGGRVVELQNSPISPKEIEARERFYGRMAWIVNAERFAKHFYLVRAKGGGVFSFRWKHMKPSWRFARSPIVLDFGTVTVKALLGAKMWSFSDFYTSDGAAESYERTTVIRYSGPSTPELEEDGYFADPSFASLSTELLDCTMLRVHTLNASGWGIGTPFPRSALLRSLGR